MCMSDNNTDDLVYSACRGGLAHSAVANCSGERTQGWRMGGRGAGSEREGGGGVKGKGQDREE